MNKKDAKQLMNQVRDIFNEWDFLGVVDAGLQDEYDCMVGPVTSLIIHGANIEKIRIYIEKELDEHFGVHSKYSKEGLYETLDKFVKLVTNT